MRKLKLPIYKLIISPEGTGEEVRGTIRDYCLKVDCLF